MTLKANWKQWSLPFCLTVSLTAGQVRGAELPVVGNAASPPVAESEDDAPAELAPATGSISDDPVELTPMPDAGSASAAQALEPAELETDTPEAEAETPAPAAEDENTSEVIEERYPNGALKLAREVVQDNKGNYQNHGSWKMFNERGAVIVEGQFYEDKRHGVWNRWYNANEVAFLKTKPFSDFTAPFISQGIFDSGDLHGAWLIYDAKQRKICEIRFSHGEREGTATWWHPNGNKMREMKFEKGVIHGDLLEWHPDGSLSAKEVYDQGRRHMTQTVFFGGDAKKFTGQFLEPELQAKKLDDWWKGEMAAYASTGKPIKHGSYTAWHQSGGMRMKGEYKYDMPVGKFTWWFPNGQKSLEGLYAEGKQEGEWSWWHENGQRSIRGYFAGGNPAGKWTWWNKEGKVAQSGDFSDEKGQIVVAPITPDESASPTAPTTPAKQAQVPTPAAKQQKRR
jgi:antitoxin component YwqK of YwqJK toxin-antitoxin module